MVFTTQSILLIVPLHYDHICIIRVYIRYEHMFENGFRLFLARKWLSRGRNNDSIFEETATTSTDTTSTSIASSL